MKPCRAIAMFSGGLDSSLAAYLIKRQGIEVIALNFQTPFNVPRKVEAGPDAAERAAAQLEVELVRKRLEPEGSGGQDYLEILKTPRHGYGRALNPCIDCRIFLVKKAAEIMREEKAQFIITGEVLGQRPMSQRRETLALIDKESGYAGLILRPLSAKLIPPTIPEEKGWVDREALLDISGRNRTRQIKLAEEFGIKDYPSPAGGCLLTEPEYSRKLKDLFQHLENIRTQDLDLLKLGRHFRLSDRLKIIIGRDHAENRQILALSGEEDVVLESQGVPGPTTLVSGSAGEEEIRLAARITARYISKRPGGTLNFKVMRGPEKVPVAQTQAEALDPKEIETYRI
jgi:tRNA-specific 2-thiouridylase